MRGAGSGGSLLPPGRGGSGAIARFSLPAAQQPVPEQAQNPDREYRGKDYATNVLSFPADLPPEVQLPLLGDIVICAAVVSREAREQNKALDAHWAHMLIHGTLHLQGYDHQNDADAKKMESREKRILAKLGFDDPYQH